MTLRLGEGASLSPDDLLGGGPTQARDELERKPPSLEQEVKTLEFGLRILKFKIMRVLLDIQEQVLNSYYPDSNEPSSTNSSPGERKIE